MSRDFERVGTRATRQSAAWWGCVVADARASSSSPPPLLTATRYIWRHRSRSRHSADGCIRKCKELWQITITTRVQVRSHWLCSSIRAACGCCFEIIFLIALSSLSSFSRRSQFFDQTARISGVVSAKFFISFNWLSNFSFFSFFFFLEDEEGNRTSVFLDCVVVFGTGIDFQWKYLYFSFIFEYTFVFIEKYVL